MGTKRFSLASLMLVVALVGLVIGTGLALPTGPRQLFVLLIVAFIGSSLLSSQAQRVLLFTLLFASFYCAVTLLSGYGRHDWLYAVLSIPLMVSVLLHDDLWTAVCFLDKAGVRPAVALTFWGSLAIVVAASMVIARLHTRRDERVQRKCTDGEN